MCKNIEKYIIGGMVSRCDLRLGDEWSKRRWV